MKAITLYQPWASLVALGEKKIETRSWATKYRGPLAIHAGMNKKFIGLINEHPFTTVLTNKIFDFPFGAIVATCRIVGCMLTTNLILKTVGISTQDQNPKWLLPNEGIELGRYEFNFGDYTSGRWAWILDDVKILKDPIPAKGMLGLWDWETPEVVNGKN